MSEKVDKAWLPPPGFDWRLLDDSKIPELVLDLTRRLRELQLHGDDDDAT